MGGAARSPEEILGTKQELVAAMATDPDSVYDRLAARIKGTDPDGDDVMGEKADLQATPADHTTEQREATQRATNGAPQPATRGSRATPAEAGAGYRQRTQRLCWLP